MININELETRWRNYKLKYYIPHAGIAIGLIVVLTVISNITPSQEIEIKEQITIDTVDIKQNNIKKVVTPKKIEVAKIEAVKVEKIVKKDSVVLKEKQKITKVGTSVKKEKTVLTPSMNFMSNMKYATIPMSNNISYQNIPDDTEYEIDKDYVDETGDIAQEQVEEQVKVSSIKISRNNSNEDLKSVIKRFKSTNNPALSLFVAEKFYKSNDYNKSLNYALITNNIDGNIDASWIVFAKSLIKLNRKDEAIKTLKSYIKHSQSYKAKILLNNINLGKFR